MLQFVTGAPVWVWPLLCILLFVGWRATRERSAPVVLLYTLPLLGISAAQTVLGLPLTKIVLPVFLAAYLVGAGVGYRLQGRWTLSHDGARVRLSGEWLTMVMILVPFTVGYLSGVLRAVAPIALASVPVLLVLVVLLGLSAGSFLGRAVQVYLSRHGMAQT